MNFNCWSPLNRLIIFKDQPFFFSLCFSEFLSAACVWEIILPDRFFRLATYYLLFLPFLRVHRLCFFLSICWCSYISMPDSTALLYSLTGSSNRMECIIYCTGGFHCGNPPASLSQFWIPTEMPSSLFLFFLKSCNLSYCSALAQSTAQNHVGPVHNPQPTTSGILYFVVSSERSNIFLQSFSVNQLN